MTTTVLDRTISEIQQDNPAIEYVDPQQNPIALREKDHEIDANDSVDQDAKDSTGLELVLGQAHNGIDCALCPTAKRACDRVWFSAKQLETWSEMSTKTLWRWLERLENAGRISRLSDMTNVNVPTATGAVKTTLYNLNVLNQLAMACIDNDKLNDVSCKFSDILSEKETEMMSGTQTPMMCLPQDYESALEALLAKVRENKALQAERDEAIHAESLAKEASRQSFQARATAMGRLSSIRFRENDVKASERMVANGIASKYKKFTAQDVMNCAWFQMMFKASQTERFYNGNPAWKPIIKELKSLLSRKANNIVRQDLENRFHDELSSTKARKVFGLWMKAKEGGVPFHEALAKINLGDMALPLCSYIDDLVCLSDRYSYTRVNGDTAYGIVYGYAYDVWARVLSSLYVREVEDYLRDSCDPDDFESTLYSVRSECYGLR